MATDGIPIDGVVDAATVGVGLIITAGKAVWKWRKNALEFSAVVVDLLNATVVVPFLLMVGAVFSSVLLGYMRSTSPVSTAIAGAIGLAFVLNELRK